MSTTKKIQLSLYDQVQSLMKAFTSNVGNSTHVENGGNGGGRDAKISWSIVDCQVTGDGANVILKINRMQDASSVVTLDDAILKRARVTPAKTKKVIANNYEAVVRADIDVRQEVLLEFSNDNGIYKVVHVTSPTGLFSNPTFGVNISTVISGSTELTELRGVASKMIIDTINKSFAYRLQRGLSEPAFKSIEIDIDETYMDISDRDRVVVERMGTYMRSVVAPKIESVKDELMALKRKPICKNEDTAAIEQGHMRLTDLQQYLNELTGQLNHSVNDDMIKLQGTLSRIYTIQTRQVLQKVLPVQYVLIAEGIISLSVPIQSLESSYKGHEGSTFSEAIMLRLNELYKIAEGIVSDVHASVNELEKLAA